ncbi:helix-turn-helix domain-containing protein [Georgenia subflava]|uniref:Helix-turn-helix domain-containing protein n=2 Tax=Georgenia subflava TaxID=1622177 RepID=A0A6N7EJQ6_9MICO|nr:helix-turn-helix domain-containing protein [Georgenia subflava]
MGPMATQDRDSRGPRSRSQVLRALRGAPDGLAAREIAGLVGLHVNSVRFHLGRLVSDGLVERATAPSGVPGRPALRFTAVARPSSRDAARDFRSLAEVLAALVADLGPSGALTEQAGRAWGQSLAGPDAGGITDSEAALTLLVDALEEVGFDPGTRTVGERIEVLQQHCPFLEVAEAHRDVVCTVHLGLMRGLLERTDAPLLVERLVPFATPQGCIAELRHRDASRS